MNGIDYSIEKELLIPVLRNRDLRRWGSQSSTMLIYPYNRETKQQIPWTVLRNSFPGTACYLKSIRKQLASRRSLRGKAWYSLIEPRLSAVTMKSPFLVAAEIGLRPTICHPTPSNASVIGNFWLFLQAEEYDIDVLMAYLNSTVAEWYLRQQSPLLSGGYILLREENLAKLPVPRFLKDHKSFVFGELKKLSTALAEKSTMFGGPLPMSVRSDILRMEEQVDSLILQAADLTSDQAMYLRSKVMAAREVAVGR